MKYKLLRDFEGLLIFHKSKSNKVSDLVVSSDAAFSDLIADDADVVAEKIDQDDTESDLSEDDSVLNNQVPPDRPYSNAYHTARFIRQTLEKLPKFHMSQLPPVSSDFEESNCFHAVTPALTVQLCGCCSRTN